MADLSQQSIQGNRCKDCGADTYKCELDYCDRSQTCIDNLKEANAELRRKLDGAINALKKVKARGEKP